MSRRGLDFFRDWVADHVDPTFSYPYKVQRAHVLAAACKREAALLTIGLQEIEDEVGELEEALLLLIEERIAGAISPTPSASA
jgi:hypothetical protein